MSDEEMLDIVDENDVILYQTTKSDCYTNRLRKRVVNIVVIDPETENIALQTRGKTVAWQPGYYCVSACGHVTAGETWEQGAARELKEELGISAPLAFIDKIDFTDDTDHSFMLGIFTVRYPHVKLKANEREVDQIFSMTLEEVGQLIDRGEKLNNLLVPVMTRIMQSEDNRLAS